ncbi:Phosphate regulon sensor protein PhoR (SphS) [Nitrincola lacisaponensis]|uniref:Phosphate regulon sensor protein PhoR n=1 Tax=Nitrincola lacisaponensis TaxID=267850 RepID=A0A063Y0V3_9GAMM|nr:phosphate regulon sensor histidine kinase PhoR [Nitrincola lacisaponensis]KDE38800.1 Phosphate regulon sensor protein PhoR (SphS) [Nitrincola lacisaponensis]
MYQSGKLMVYSLLITLLVSGLIGWILGYPREALIISLFGWSLYQIYLFERVMKWLKREDGSEPPEAPGAWGDLLDGLYRLQRRGHDKERALRGIINRFQHSSAALQDAVVIIDQKDNLEWWNRSAERLLGLSPKSDRRRSILNLLRDPRFIRYYRKHNYQEPLELTSPINEQVTLQYHITHFGQGDRLLVARDITRLKKLEQTRQSFVSNASHELRTPLTVIRGYLETFQDQELPKPLMRGLQQMEQQTLRMEGLVRDMLMLSRLESTEHVTEDVSVDIHQMLKEIRRDALILSGDQQHQISIDADPRYDLLGQDKELHSAFSNLVFNAVRHTPAQAEIRIRWKVDVNGGHLSVEDNGPGIEPFHLPRLTERFYRVDESRSSDSGGTGLGLSIVKYVMVRHGGQLKIQSSLGKGSCFSCHFPPDSVIALENEALATHNG